MKSRQSNYTRLVLSILDSSRDSLTQAEIMDELETQGFTPHRSTIYRVLQQLLRNNSIILSTTDISRVSYACKDSHNHSIVCVKCNTTTCLSDTILREVEDTLHHMQSLFQKQSGYSEVVHTLDFYGLCKSCSQ